MKNTAGPLRVGMIGAGNIGANYLRAARFFEQMKVVVCADLNAACFGQPRSSENTVVTLSRSSSRTESAPTQND
jgi:predicted homoserine dehydrogenase-like protein